jgi:predicted nucleic acid-binding protein
MCPMSSRSIPALTLASAPRSPWLCIGRVLVIVDDRCGRAEARSRGLPIIGTAAVLVVAKQQQLIPACAPLMAALREEGYYLSDGLMAAVLAEVDED